MTKRVSVLLAAILFAVATMGSSHAFAAPENRPIVIQGAMDVETQFMISKLADVEELTMGGWRFFKGTLEGYPVVIAKTEVGMTNAAASTVLAIETFNPSAIINQGTSGGHDPKLHRYDIVLGTTSVNFGNFRTEHGDAGKGVKPEKWIPMTLTINVKGEPKEFQDFKGDSHLLKVAENTAGTYKNGKVVKGVIGSADQWNRELDRIDWIHATYKTSAEEMETASAAQVAEAYGVPFLGIRILSNSEIHDEGFDPKAGVYCQEYVLNVVKKLIR
ncbi:5'-methylthioadenosine/S-adenosylhomocysteine nucleosidase [Desulfoluna spongiiphila]|uniref:5'-methylthioadenosine/S-adenosylhomocysteine nucleosidase n=1 Tax=Desulfoluna spongiiphila TaxID=419481 RepID=UPI001257CD11|nr:5'-methylthioadenosine/S-adenosylhomocysteine nucleosidase [Desulfoluna spongiiphila]VVS91547.1 nucleoside phosphorylase superfamily [Desulfoluna spongiiphila]